MQPAKLYDLTDTNVIREMDIHRKNSHPFADGTFRRHIHHVTTKDERSQATDRLRRLRDRRVR